jgi:nitrite reductase/ring-hydroxylating ferredoxin subunit
LPAETDPGSPSRTAGTHGAADASGSFRLCRVEELDGVQTKGFVLGEGSGRLQIFVVRHQDRLLGFVNSCPHLGVPLDWVPDRFLDRERRHILCATHGALFRIQDGLCVRGPCDGQSLTPVPLTIRTGELFADPVKG